MTPQNLRQGNRYYHTTSGGRVSRVVFVGIEDTDVAYLFKFQSERRLTVESIPTVIADNELLLTGEQLRSVTE